MLICGRFQFDLSRPLVMGILNVTPDSFSDGGRFSSLDVAMRHAEQMLADGVDIIDVGGESSRPNAPYVSPQQETERIMPVLQALQSLNVPVSLDTRRSEVMRVALAEQAVDLINDIEALADGDAVSQLADAPTVGICLMHMQGQPGTMQQSPHYENVVTEVGDYLGQRVRCCLEAGIARERLLADPGFGFGKTLAHNLALLRELDEVERRAGVPLLVGLSRKSMLGAITGETEPDQRLGASVAAAMESVRRGAAIVRVHDVKATRQALQVLSAL